jgi:TRAP-type uncharacterized transport system fused permease subunit
MPTPAAYALAAALIAPTLVQTFKVPLMQAHLFLLYFAVLSAITPPVAVAAYAASAISGSNPLAIALAGCKLAMFGFILPFIVVYDPSILLKGDWSEILLGVAAATSVVVLLAVAIEGYLNRQLSAVPRLLFGTASICLVFFEPFLALLGLAAAALGYLIHRLSPSPRNEVV